MNPNSFSILGYLSVLLWLAVPVLLLMRRRISAPPWLALLLAVLSLVFATINSRTHVDRIEVEATAQTSDQLVLEAAKRKAVEKARGNDVANIRFAEDGAHDFIDKAGMDEADSKYLDSLNGSAEPAWKKQKKSRGETAEGEGDVDEMLGSKEKASGVSSESLETTESKREPIVMSEAHKLTANRLDKINLTVTRLAFLLCIVMLVIDYLSNANRYDRAAYPLPLPGYWRNTFTMLPTIVHRPQPPRRTVAEELAWIVRRGEVFICFTKDAASLPESLPRLGKSKFPVDVLCIDGDRIPDTFVFEALWYGRCCFVVNSPTRAHALFSSICKQLEQRHFMRAHTNQSVHVVWNLDEPPSDQELAAFEFPASNTGFSLFICHESKSNPLAS